MPGREAAQLVDLVVAEVERGQACELLQVLDPPDLVVGQIQRGELWVSAGDLADKLRAENLDWHPGGAR